MLEFWKLTKKLMKTQRKTKTHAQKLKTTQWNSNLAHEFERKTQNSWNLQTNQMTHEDEDTIEGVEKLLIPLIGFHKEELMFAQIATLLELAFIQIF